MQLNGPSPPHLKPAATDLAARQPVWEALADLFLDTDTSLARQWHADRLAGSPYSVEQLECILLEEVYPVCKYNLYSIAGEWAGFDPEWLRTEILRRLASPFRISHRFSLGRVTILKSTQWRATRKAIVALRAQRQPDQPETPVG